MVIAANSRYALTDMCLMRGYSKANLDIYTLQDMSPKWWEMRGYRWKPSLFIYGAGSELVGVHKGLRGTRRMHAQFWVKQNVNETPMSVFDVQVQSRPLLPSGAGVHILPSNEHCKHTK